MPTPKDIYLFILSSQNNVLYVNISLLHGVLLGPLLGALVVFHHVRLVEPANISKKLLFFIYKNLNQAEKYVILLRSHRRSMETEAKANCRCCFMGENCRTHGFY